MSQKSLNNDTLQPRSIEMQQCLDSLEYILKYKEPEDIQLLLQDILDRTRQHGVCPPPHFNTPYINTIPATKEPEYPGDMEAEEAIMNIIRWNAMAMVIKANRHSDGIGGHISSFASCCMLYEVGQNPS